MNANTLLPPVSVLVIARQADLARAAIAAAWPDAECEVVPDVVAGRRMLSVWVSELVVTVFPAPGGTLASLFPSGGPVCIAVTSDLEGELMALESGASEVTRGWSSTGLTQANARWLARAQEVELEAVPKALRPYFTGIAHEVNNPLTVLKTNLEMLSELPADLRDASDDAEEHALICEDFADLVSQCQEVASRIGRVTRRLMSLQRIGDTRVQDVRPEASVRRALDRLLTEFPDSPVPTVVWKTQARVHAATLSIEEALYELLHNAYLASTDRGSVEVEIVGLEHAVEFRVTDRGAGVPEEIRNQMFEPFKTTRAPGDGPGLGLTLVQAAARRCGGEAGCARPEGGPTVFWFQLPLGISGDAVNRADRDEGDDVQDRPRVLLVDTDEQGVDAWLDLLEPTCRVVHAASGAAAVALLGAIRDWSAVLIAGGPDSQMLLRALEARVPRAFQLGQVAVLQTVDSDPLVVSQRASHAEVAVLAADDVLGFVRALTAAVEARSAS